MNKTNKLNELYGVFLRYLRDTKKDLVAKGLIPTLDEAIIQLELDMDDVRNEEGEDAVPGEDLVGDPKVEDSEIENNHNERE